MCRAYNDFCMLRLWFKNVHQIKLIFDYCCHPAEIARTCANQLRSNPADSLKPSLASACSTRHCFSLGHVVVLGAYVCSA